MHSIRCIMKWGVTQEGVFPVELVLFSVRHQNRIWTLKVPQSQKWLQSVSMCLTKLTWLIFFETRLFYTQFFLYQDKDSAIKFEKNGRNSCTGISRHISIRYFFVKDRVDKEKFSIEYCNTSAMIADFFTKPLQGSLFWRLREAIMRWVHVDILQDYVPSPKKERVKNHVSGDEPEIEQKVIVSGSQIRSAYWAWWSKVRTREAGGILTFRSTY